MALWKSGNIACAGHCCGLPSREWKLNRKKAARRARKRIAWIGWRTGETV